MYACETCQPLQPPEEDTGGAALAGASGSPAVAPGLPVQLDAARRKALDAAKPARLFASHCAPDDAADMDPAKMKVSELKVRGDDQLWWMMAD